MTGVAGVQMKRCFGPLLRVWRYDSFEEAILMANNTRFGLSCGLVSPEREKFDQLLLEARAGIALEQTAYWCCQYRAIRRHWCIR
ncbi:aldehyde dehydrogenase family protein [Escherichia coli]